jgi:uncharacterized protein YybS (DUF2232 family)
VSVDVRTGERPDPRTSGALGAGLLAALLFSCLVVPHVGVLAAVVSPLPLILQRLRGGTGSALMAVGVAAAIVAVVFAPGFAVAFLFMLASPGLLIGEAMARGRGLRKGCAWAFGLIASEIVVLLVFASPQMAARAVQPFEPANTTRSIELLRSLGWPPETLEAMAESSETLRSALLVVYPAAFLILGALVVLANAAVLRTYLARRDPGWLDGGEFETIRWPLGLSVLFVVAGLSVVVPPLRAVGYNILLLLAFFYALQGLAVVGYYGSRLAGPPILRLGLMALVLLNPWAPRILALLGLFDTWFDFRRWADPPAEGEGR